MYSGQQKLPTSSWTPPPPPPPPCARPPNGIARRPCSTRADPVLISAPAVGLRGATPRPASQQAGGSRQRLRRGSGSTISGGFAAGGDVGHVSVGLGDLLDRAASHRGHAASSDPRAPPSEIVMVARSSAARASRTRRRQDQMAADDAMCAPIDSISIRLRPSSSCARSCRIVADGFLHTALFRSPASADLFDAGRLELVDDVHQNPAR